MKNKLISLALALVMCLGLAIPASAAEGFDWDGATEVKNFEEFLAAALDEKVEKIKITGEVTIPKPVESPLTVETPTLIAKEGKLTMAEEAVMFVHVPMGQFSFEDAENTWDLVAEMGETFIMWHPDEDTYNRDIFGTQPDINEEVKNADGEPINSLVMSGDDVTLTDDLAVEATFQIHGHNLTIAKGVKVEVGGMLYVDGDLTLEEGASLTVGEGSSITGKATFASEDQKPENLEIPEAPAEDEPAAETPAEDEKPVNPFEDVAEASPFYNAILWAVEQGITNGVSSTSFAPNNTCTRAQIITFLWRANGKPEAQLEESPYSDVSADAMNADFYNAIMWAAEKEMYEGETFAPNDPCTRAMAVDFIWKAAVKAEDEEIEAPTFTDVAEDSPYMDGIAWAVAHEITLGTGDGTTFSPDNICTRGQIVTFLYRAANTPVAVQLPA